MLRCTNCYNVFTNENELLHNIKYGKDKEISKVCPYCMTDKYLVNIGECIILDTFPDDDNDYQKCFIVEKKFFENILSAFDSFNERKGIDIERFLQNYIWDETEAIYKIAKAQDNILAEWVE